MAVINVTSGNQAILTLGNTALNAATGVITNGVTVPFVQDITVNATPGTVRYSTLDSTSSSAFTTVNENSISLNVLVDEKIMFGNAAATTNSVALNGLLPTSIAKTEVFFSVSVTGSGTAGDINLNGKGFIGGLAPSASIDGAVWLSPMEIIVNGELSKGVNT